LDQILALRTFVRIAHAGSMAKAAGTLDLPRSTVSKLLQDLEDHLGVRLLNRTTRAVAVTAEGADYYERALRLLEALDEMDASAKGGASAPSGRLRVDIGSVLANLILIPQLPRFQARYPEIELVLGVSDRPVDLIGEGVDCVIRGGALADSTLVARKLCELAYVTCATPGYIEQHGAPVRPEDLGEGHQTVTYFSAALGAFPMRFTRDGEKIEIRAKSSINVNESTAHMTALRAGLGLAQTFEFVARPDLADGRLIEVLSDFAPAPHPLHLVYPGGRQISAKLRAFSDWAAEIFAAV
jgi:DNA-binding transcriptional LysR family regulator